MVIQRNIESNAHEAKITRNKEVKSLEQDLANERISAFTVPF